MRRERPGWTLYDAARRCVRRETLSACMKARREWLAAGGPSRFVWQHPEIHPEADSANAATKRRAALNKSASGAALAVKAALWSLLEDERLVATARRGSRLNDTATIPASAWVGLRPGAWKTPSSLKEKPSKVANLFDVRVYPVMDAPNAASILDDMTLVHAVDQYVWRDPEAETLRAYAAEVGGKAADLGWGLDRVWPLSYDEQFVWRDLIGFLNDIGSTADTRAKLADAVVARRFASFMALLASGTVEVEGLPPRGGGLTTVPKSIWIQSEVYLDVANGDLVKSKNPRGYFPIFCALMLRDPSRRRIVQIHADAVPTKPKVVPKTTAHLRAEDECIGLLADAMRKSPHARTMTKERFFAQMRDRYGEKLSERAFERAWAAAVLQSGAHAWSNPGAPRRNE